jgi:hypothetical protein
MRLTVGAAGKPVTADGEAEGHIAARRTARRLSQPALKLARRKQHWNDWIIRFSVRLGTWRQWLFGISQDEAGVSVIECFRGGPEAG